MLVHRTDRLVSMKYQISEGDYTRMGVTEKGTHIIFTFEGEKEDKCKVVLISRDTREEVKIDVPDEYCLGSLRSIAVAGIDTEQYDYYYEINEAAIVDPYATQIAGRESWNDRSRKKDDYQIYGRFDFTSFQWEKDTSPEIPKSKMLMYKLHVRGFTMDQKGTMEHAGTFHAIGRRLKYLKELGVTTVEIMPLYEFEEIQIPVKQELPEYLKWQMEKDDLILQEADTDSLADNTRINYWGYGPGNYFAVKSSYAADKAHPANEFRKLVQQLHKLGMECVMEMYYPNQTNHNLILDSIHYWVRDFHVDGFHLLGEKLPITAIVQDVMLSRTKIFYEEFDASLLENEKKYKHLFVYKDEYLFPARRILNHINGDMQEFANQQKKQAAEAGFVNYIASNNGFTLADLFMYNDKHNEANGENNEDGPAWNFSNNYGVEGTTRKRYITELRKRQWRNAWMMLLTAQGIPLIWSGDEMENSQNGNNNAYCQDNPLGWLNWKNYKNHRTDVEFVKKLIEFREKHPILAKDEPFFFNDHKSKGFPDLSYHGESAWITGIQPGRMSLGMLYCGAYDEKEADDIYIAYNFFSGISTLALPQLGKKKKWYAVANSAEHGTPFYEEPVEYKNQQALTLSPQSIYILIGK